MKKKLLSLLILFFLLSAPWVKVVSADERPSKVTISYIEHIPPFWFRDTDGNLQGIGPDYWRLWGGKKLGIEVEFKLRNWQASLDAVLYGHADFHSGMVQSEERKKIFDFASKPMVTTEEFIFVRTDLDVSVPSQLGKIPVWTDGGISKGILQDKFPDMVLLDADGYETINKMIEKRSADAFVMDFDIAAFSLAKLNASGKYKKKIYSVFKQPLYTGVKKKATIRC